MVTYKRLKWCNSEESHAQTRMTKKLLEIPSNMITPST